MGRRITPLVAALCLLFAISNACLAYPSVGDRAPDFTVAKMGGGTFKLSDCFKDSPKVVILDFWASWCSWCTLEIPQLISIQEDYASRGLLVVGVTRDSPVTNGYDYAQSVGVNYTICGDANFTVTKPLYGDFGIPHTYVIDRTGRITYDQLGYDPSDPDMLALRAAAERAVPEPSSICALLTGIMGCGLAWRRKHS